GPSWKPSPTIAPSETTTEPTMGLGDTMPPPRLASSIARSMYASSDMPLRPRGEDGERGRPSSREAAAPPVLSHPDFDGRSRNLTGSAPEWRSGGRGLSPPVGICTPPRRQALLEGQYRSLARRGHRAWPGGGPGRGGVRAGG